MHELSIALGIVDIAREEAARQGGARIQAVHLRLGALSGVVKDSLLFSYEIASRETELEGSCLVVEEVPVVIFCPRCKAQRPVRSVQNIACSTCGNPSAEVTQGKEIQIVAMEVEEP